MEYANHIVCLINESLKQLHCDIELNGIARTIVDPKSAEEKGGISFPGTIDFTGECKEIELENKAIVVYHKCISIQTSQSNKQGFGRSLNPLTVKMKMCIVVFSDTTKTKLSADQIALNIHGIIPRESIKSILTGVKNTSILINDAILNESQVYSEEFKNVDSFLGPEHSLIKINYTVESTVSQKCFNTICKQTS